MRTRTPPAALALALALVVLAAVAATTSAQLATCAPKTTADATATTATAPPLPEHPYQVADLDLDGRVDVVASTATAGVWMMWGAPSPPVTTSSIPAPVSAVFAIGDVAATPLLDLVLVHTVAADTFVEIHAHALTPRSFDAPVQVAQRLTPALAVVLSAADIVVAWDGAPVEVFLATGGTYADSYATSFTSDSAFSNNLVLFDINGDGLDDIVAPTVALPSARFVSYLLATAPSNFSVSTQANLFSTRAASTGTRLYAGVDVDADGADDLVAADADGDGLGQTTIVFYFGPTTANTLAATTAASAIAIDTASSTIELAFGDVDADADADVVALFGDGTIKLFSSRGAARSFIGPLPVISIGTGSAVTLALAYPFLSTPNGRAELVYYETIPTPEAHTVANIGPDLAFGSFAQIGTDRTSNSRRFSTAVVNHDALVDVYTAGAAGLNFGTSYTELVNTAAVGSVIGLADVSGDGLVDIVLINDEPFINVRLGTSPTTFAPAILMVDISSTPILPAIYAGFLADLTGDGALDIAFVGDGLSARHIFVVARTDPTLLTGWASTPVQLANDASGATEVYFRAFDANGDGLLDLVYGAGAQISWYVSIPGAVYSSIESATNIAVEGELSAIDAADLNGDGVLDFVICDPGSTGDDLRALYSNAPSFTTYTLAPISDPPVSPVHLALVDFGIGRARADLVFIEGSGNLGIYLNDGSPTPAWLPGNPSLVDIQAATGPMIRFGFVDMNGDGWLDLVVGTGTTLWTAPATVSSLSSTIVTRNVDASALVAAQGYTVATLAGALATAGTACSPTAVVRVPTDRPYTGCFSATAFVVAANTDVTLEPLVPGARIVIDCSATGGVLFQIPAAAALTLRNVDIIGATATPSGTLSTSPLVVSGASAKLTLANVTATACTSTVATGGGPQTQPGHGAVVAVSGFAELVVTDSVFTSNSAEVSGGVIAVSYSGSASVATSQFVSNSAGSRGGAIVVDLLSTLTVDTTTFVTNSAGAEGGAVAVTAASVASLALVSATGNTAEVGGALYIRGTDTAVTFADLTLSANTAVVAGGAFAVIGASSFSGPRLTAVGNAAAYGGAFAAVTRVGVLPTAAGLTSDLVPIGTNVAATDSTFPTVLITGGASTLGPNTASLGGTAYLCGATVTATGTATGVTSVASVLGPLAFVCASQPVAALGTLTSVPWFTPLDITVPAALSACASPAVTVDMMDVPAAAVSGIALGAGTAVLRDYFGVPVVDTGVSVTVRVLAPAALAGGVVQTAPSAAGAVALDNIAVTTLVADIGTVAVVQVDVVASAAAGLTVKGTAGVVVGACPPAFGRSSEVGAQVVCSRCAQDSVSDATSTDPCVAQTQCPNNALFRNATLSADCWCFPGFYPPNGTTTTVKSDCLECPAGGRCVGALEPPVAASGYFPDAARAGVFYQCIRTEACAGNGECAPNYTGFLCTSCTSSAYRDANGACVACPDSSVALSLLVAGAAVVAVLLASLVFFIVRRAVKAEKQTITGGLAVVRSVSMLLIFVQVVAVIGKSDVEWSSDADRMFEALSGANLSLELFATECSVGSYYEQFALAMLLPLAAYIAIGIVLVVLVLAIPVRPWSRPKLLHVTSIKALVWLAPLAYVSLARASLSFLDCTRIANGAYVLDIDTSEECFSDTWWSYFPVAMYGIIVYVVGIPLGLAAALYRHHSQLRSVDVFATYGGLYGMFRTEVALYELVLMARRLGVVVIVTFLTQYPGWQILLLHLLVTTGTVASAKLLPYRYVEHNRLESTLNVMTLIIVACGTVFLAGDKTSRSAEAFASVVVIAAVVAAIVAAGFTLFRELSFVFRGACCAAPTLEDAKTSATDNGARLTIGHPLPFFASPRFASPHAQLATSGQLLKMYVPNLDYTDAMFDAVLGTVKAEVDRVHTLAKLADTSDVASYSSSSISAPPPAGPDDDTSGTLTDDSLPSNISARDFAV